MLTFTLLKLCIMVISNFICGHFCLPLNIVFTFSGSHWFGWTKGRTSKYSYQTINFFYTFMHAQKH